MDTAVIVALITAISAVLVALIPTLASHRTRSAVVDRLGTPNGSGTVVEMLEHSLERAASTDMKLDQIVAEQARHAALDTHRFEILAHATGLDPAALTQGDTP